MQMFNKRTWQLVLGAGALQTVGLKSITAKHLGSVKGEISYFENRSRRVVFALISHVFSINSTINNLICCRGKKWVLPLSTAFLNHLNSIISSSMPGLLDLPCLNHEGLPFNNK